jgi:glutathione synthase/RimK-type ligase-like ATP-grasp enzyme
MIVSMQSDNHPPTPPPVIGIFCHELTPGGDPFSSDYYWQAYQDLILALREQGVQAYLLTDNNTYRGYDNLFDTAYAVEGKTPLDALQKVHNVTVDLVFDRGRFVGRDIAMLNPPIMTKIASSKIEMYEYFTDLQPYSFITGNKKQLLKAANRLPGDKIVVKEPEGSGGNEVYIGAKDEVLAEAPKDFPLLVQEFTDTSVGVPGQVEGAHDVRVALCGGEIISYYARIPAEGRLHANVAQGGSVVYFDVHEVPEALREVVYQVDALFAEQPRYYSLDFMHTTKGWKLVELNSYLGLVPASEGEQATQTLLKLSGYLAIQAREAQAIRLGLKT